MQKNDKISNIFPKSNDVKIFPTVITHFDNKSKKIENALLAMPVLKGDSTGQNISNLMLQKYQEFNIPGTNLE